MFGTRTRSMRGGERGSTARCRHTAAIVRLAVGVMLLGLISGCGLIWTPPEAYRASDDWQDGNPFGFLALLASSSSTGFRVREPVDGFVHERNLEALMNLTESDRPCAAVLLSDDPNVALPVQFSTLGNEAAYLIEGFRAGRYPPRASSIDPPPDRAELRQWWESRKSR